MEPQNNFPITQRLSVFRMAYCTHFDMPLTGCIPQCNLTFPVMNEPDELHLTHFFRPKIGLKIQNNYLFLSSITSWTIKCNEFMHQRWDYRCTLQSTSQIVWTHQLLMPVWVHLFDSLFHTSGYSRRSSAAHSDKLMHCVTDIIQL